MRLINIICIAATIASVSPVSHAETALVSALPAIKTVTTRAGMVYVNGQPFIGDGWNASTVDTVANSPGNVVRWPYGGFYNDAEAAAAGKTVDLDKTEPIIGALEKSGKYAVIIFEPYWGQPNPKWDQVDWEGKHRGGSGLDTNACWRNADFIADRLKKVTETIAYIKSIPRLHDRVLGYIIWNENRWAMGEETCYCNYCRSAWADWLQAQYHSVAAMNTAYHTQYKSFADAEMPHPTLEALTPLVGMESMRMTETGPARHVSNEVAWRDFHLFKADGLIAFENLGSAAAKQVDPSRVTITSLFTRGVNPSIGHVLTRLYRGMGDSKTVDIIGGNQYEAMSAYRQPRNIEMWRSTPSAHLKPVWFTEFNDIAGPWDTPYNATHLNSMLAHTTFSGESGRIWFTDKDQTRLSVLEFDGSEGERYRAIKAASDFQSAHIDNVIQAAANDLPPQVGIIHLDQWNALADNGNYNAASLGALAAFGEWGGYAVSYLSEPDISGKNLSRYKVLVLWQAQRQADISADILDKLKSYVKGGGILICDPPMLEAANGVGPPSDWAAFTGVTFSREQERRSVLIDNKQIGKFELGDLLPAGTPAKGMGSLPTIGQWMVDTDSATSIVRDTTGQPAVVIRKQGKGSVITLCFRLGLSFGGADMQPERARFLRKLLDTATFKPLVDAPLLEKTIAPQDNNGLIVTFFNPGATTVESPLAFPGRKDVKIETLRMPSGATMADGKLNLPAGEWAVVTVK